MQARFNFRFCFNATAYARGTLSCDVGDGRSLTDRLGVCDMREIRARENSLASRVTLRHRSRSNTVYDFCFL